MNFDKGGDWYQKEYFLNIQGTRWRDPTKFKPIHALKDLRYLGKDLKILAILGILWSGRISFLQREIHNHQFDLKRFLSVLFVENSLYAKHLYDSENISEEAFKIIV